MGCDIHVYLDVVESEPDPERGHEGWVSTFAGPISLGRDYDLFGVLAGVRGGQAVFTPRGLPPIDELGFTTQRDYWLGITDTPTCEYCGECNHVTPNDVEAWGNRTTTHKGTTYCQHPDWHSPSYLYLHELEKVVEAYPGDKKYLTRLKGVMALMKALNGRKRKRSRLVFWFDN
jgi:hypothetical protein